MTGIAPGDVPVDAVRLTDATRFATGYLTELRSWVTAHITFPR